MVENNHPYVGMWITADGRHNLLPNGRYDEAWTPSSVVRYGWEKLQHFDFFDRKRPFYPAFLK